MLCRDEQFYRNRIKYRNWNRNIYQVLESRGYWYCRLWFFGIDIETEIEGCELRYRNWYCYCRITFAEPKSKLKLRKLSLNWIWNQVPQFQYHRQYQSVSNSMRESVEYLSLSDYLKTHEMIHTGDRQFKCTRCGNRFSLSGYFKKHMKSSTHVWHVNSSAQSVEVDSLYQNTFQNTWNVLHMWTHTGEKAIQVHKVWQ